MVICLHITVSSLNFFELVSSVDCNAQLIEARTIDFVMVYFKMMVLVESHRIYWKAIAVLCSDCVHYIHSYLYQTGCWLKCCDMWLVPDWLQSIRCSKDVVLVIVMLSMGKYCRWKCCHVAWVMCWWWWCVAAYKHADGKKIDGRRVLVDVERGRTVKGWRPRRLGQSLVHWPSLHMCQRLGVHWQTMTSNVVLSAIFYAFMSVEVYVSINWHYN